MNKIKMFLGVAVLSMAVAGAFATKASKWASQNFYYVFNTNSGNCELVSQDIPCETPGTGCVDARGFQIYKAIISPIKCDQPVTQP